MAIATRNTPRTSPMQQVKKEKTLLSHHRPLVQVSETQIDCVIDPLDEPRQFSSTRFKVSVRTMFLERLWKDLRQCDAEFEKWEFDVQNGSYFSYFSAQQFDEYVVSSPFIDIRPEAANWSTIPRRSAYQRELPDAFTPEDGQCLRLDQMQSLTNQASGWTPERRSPLRNSPPAPTSPIRFIRDLHCKSPN